MFIIFHFFYLTDKSVLYRSAKEGADSAAKSAKENAEQAARDAKANAEKVQKDADDDIEQMLAELKRKASNKS